jgi:hypothetical protein
MTLATIPFSQRPKNMRTTTHPLAGPSQSHDGRPATQDIAPLFSTTCKLQRCVTTLFSQPYAKHPGYTPLPAAQSKPILEGPALSPAALAEPASLLAHSTAAQSHTALTNWKARAYNALSIKQQ